MANSELIYVEATIRRDDVVLARAITDLHFSEAMAMAKAALATAARMANSTVRELAMELASVRATH